MNPAPELAPQLKSLRLSGILDSLAARNRQAIESKLAYTAFLALLISDEVARRDQKKFSTRLRRAQFRTTKIIEQFDFDRLPHLNRALVHDLATGAYERTITVVTNNLDYKEWDQAFAVNRLLGSATLDRLRHNAYCLELDGQSYRAPQLLPKAGKTVVKKEAKSTIV